MFKTHEHDHICVHKDSVLRIFALFFRAMKHPDLFPEVDSDLEGPLEPPFEPVFDEEWRVYRFLGVRSSRRHHLAFQLSMAAILFLLDHEFGHIYHGHTRYFETVRGHRALLMSGNQFTDETTQYEHKAMEMDADAFACCRVMSVMAAMLKQSQNGVWNPEYELTESNAHPFLIGHLAITGFFLVISEQEDMVRINEETGYLPSKVRLALIFDAAKNYLTIEKNVVLNTQALDRQLGIFFKIYQEILGSPISGKDLGILSSPDMMEAVRRTQDAWVTLRPKLEPHAFYPLPKPSQSQRSKA